MPNYCNNNLILTHDDPEMVVRAFNALECGEFLSEFIPVPLELKKTMSGFHGDPDKQARLEAQNTRNLAKYGYKDWYDYCVGEWGTKWDVGEQGASDIHPGGRMLHTFFDSAWSPPINAYEKLVELGFGVEAMYYEGGMAFAGTWTNGSDEYVDLGGMSADAIEQNYADLDECFGISESMRECEEELTEWIKDGVEKNKELAKTNENI